MIRPEPPGVDRVAGGGVTTTQVVTALFHSRLAARDAQETPFPVLAQTLPELNSDRWSPDGRMETAYRSTSC
jgi:hypothetical protein